ncbi:MAG TPA: hypothetical protein VK843_04150 [Planctomycetota bacterium]|nr:hypothetical protein [Planctomycetota bacterium]
MDHGGLVYPTFEIFKSAPAFKLLSREADTVSLSQISGIAALLDEQLRPRVRDDGSPFVSAFDESAELEPRVPPEELLAYRIAPLVFMRLERAWDEPVWTIADVTEAVQGSAILRQIPDAPEPRFVQGQDAANHRGLEELVRWFHRLEQRPECLAAMIFTLDAGPFAGTPLAGEALHETKSVRKLADGFDLRIAPLIGEPEPCALQCVREGQVMWTSVLSGQPAGRVSSAELADMDAIDLGPWGWLVVMRVESSRGAEHAHVYVDRNGGLRFYFLGH